MGFLCLTIFIFYTSSCCFPLFLQVLKNPIDASTLSPPRRQTGACSNTKHLHEMSAQNQRGLYLLWSNYYCSSQKQKCHQTFIAQVPSSQEWVTDLHHSNECYLLRITLTSLVTSFKSLGINSSCKVCCALIVHFHYLVCTGCALAAVRLKKEVIKGMEIQPLIIQSWNQDQWEVSCSCSWKSDLSTEKPGRECSSAAASSPSIRRLILNWSWRGGRTEQKKEGREGYFYFSPFSYAPPLLHTFFSQAELKSRKLEPNILAILNRCIMHFFRNVTKAFSSKGDEIPLIIALWDTVISWECHKNAIKRHFILASGGSTLIYFDLNSFFHLCKRGTWHRSCTKWAQIREDRL